MRIHERARASTILSRLRILLIVGMLVSAQQISAESIFTQRGALSLDDLRLDPPDFSSIESPGSNIPLYADTLEMYDIELEEEDERNIYKEIAAYVIVAGAIGYMIYTFIKPDEEEETPSSGGKEAPVLPAFSIPIPINRSP